MNSNSKMLRKQEHVIETSKKNSQKMRFYYKKINVLSNSYKKQEDSLEGGLDRVLFVAELEFLKILVPNIPQITSNLKTECFEDCQHIPYSHGQTGKMINLCSLLFLSYARTELETWR